MRQISILGCGWLGLPLAKSLVEKGFSVNGSTTSAEKIPLLQKDGITPFQILLNENDIDGNVLDFLENAEILIVDIPPKTKANPNENFVSKINTLLTVVEKSNVQKIIFVSSTSVFADDNSVVTSETIPNPETENGRQLLLAEQLFKTGNFQATIVRFGGLIGDDRHPIHFLSGRENVANPEAYVNLIHQKDCIGIIQAIIEKDIWDETFNAVAPQHPSRQTYYNQKAIELNLPLPQFDYSKPSVGKTISDEKIETVLGYQFQISLH